MCHFEKWVPALKPFGTPALKGRQFATALGSPRKVKRILGYRGSQFYGPTCGPFCSEHHLGCV